MLNLLIVFVSGLLFGLGLIVAGMVNPGKVLGFLDLAGNWNPSLAFVMISGILIAAFGYQLTRKMSQSVLGQPFHFPALNAVDLKLVSGSAIFGLGWGLAGICPGPAIVLLGSGVKQGLIFVVAMLVGMVCFELLNYFAFKRHILDGDKLST